MEFLGAGKDWIKQSKVQVRGTGKEATQNETNVDQKEQHGTYEESFILAFLMPE